MLSIISTVGRSDALLSKFNIKENFKSKKCGSQVADIARRCNPVSRKSRIGIPNLMENQIFWYSSSEMRVVSDNIMHECASYSNFIV